MDNYAHADQGGAQTLNQTPPLIMFAQSTMRTSVTRSTTLAVLAVAAFALAGCSNSTGGTATTSATSTGSSSGSATDGKSLASYDPCTQLLTPAEIAQFGLSSGKQDNTGGSRGCRWTSASNGYALQVAIWDTQGIKGANVQGGRVSTVPVGKHDGQRLEEPSGLTGTCLVAIGVTSSSRIDVVVTESDQDFTKACQVATQVATKIEPKL